MSGLKKKERGSQRKTFKEGRFLQKAVILKAFILNHGQNENDGCCSCSLFEPLFLCVLQQMCIEDETQNHICYGYTQKHSKSSQKPSRTENRAAAVILTWSNERLKPSVSELQAKVFHTHIRTPDLTQTEVKGLKSLLS